MCSHLKYHLKKPDFSTSSHPRRRLRVTRLNLGGIPLFFYSNLQVTLYSRWSLLLPLWDPAEGGKSSWINGWGCWKWLLVSRVGLPAQGFSCPSQGTDLWTPLGQSCFHSGILLSMVRPFLWIWMWFSGGKNNLWQNFMSGSCSGPAPGAFGHIPPTPALPPKLSSFFSLCSWGMRNPRHSIKNSLSQAHTPQTQHNSGFYPPCPTLKVPNPSRALSALIWCAGSDRILVLNLNPSPNLIHLPWCSKSVTCSNCFS